MSYPPQNQGYPPPASQGYPQSAPGYYPPPHGQGLAYQPAGQQPHYIQQQVYYQPGEPQGYPQGQPQAFYHPQQPAVTIQPAKFEQSPVRCQCPHCHAIVDSKVKREIGTTTCIHCLFFSCVCCCCLPFFMDCSKDASHFCPNCKKHLATFKQPAVQSGGGSGGGFRRPSHEGPQAGDDGYSGGGGDGDGDGGD